MCFSLAKARRRKSRIFQGLLSEVAAEGANNRVQQVAEGTS